MTGTGQSAVRAGEDPRDRARRLRAVRDAVLSHAPSDGPPDESALRPVISDSWRRLRSTGLDPSGTGQGPHLTGADLRQRRERSPLAEVLPLLRRHLLPAAEAVGQVLVVGDAQGTVLWREGPPSARRRADGLGFTEGSSWDERSVGTNAIGTSLVVGTPVHVFAGEHYAETHQPWTCAAAPLHDLAGRVVGAVDLSGPAPTVHASTVALVEAVARLADLELRALHTTRHEGLRRLVGSPEPGVVVVADDGCTIAAPDGVPTHLTVTLDGSGLADVAALGTCTAEPLPGGWLLRPATVVPGSSLLEVGEGWVRFTTSAGGWNHRLSPRHRELLELLADHPDGLTAAELAGAVFGDPARTVTVRAELSRLRRLLGPVLLHRPYRIDPRVRLTVDHDRY